MSKLEQLTKQPERNLGVLSCGQGMQREDMLGILLRSSDPIVKKSAEEVIDGKGGLRDVSPGVVDVYTTKGTDASTLNDTVFVQPGTAALVITLFNAYQKKLGIEVTPDFAGGYSLGDYISTFMLGVLSQKDVLSLISLRGEVFRPANPKLRRIEPGQYSILTLLTNGEIDQSGLNSSLWGTGYKVTIPQAENAFTIAGPESSRAVLEGKLSGLKEQGKVLKIISSAKDVFKDPFHLDYAMEPFAAEFSEVQRQYCRTESRERRHHVFLEPNGGFITGDARMLTSGTDIMRYLGFPHIKEPFDAAAMMRLIGSSSKTVIGFGGLSAQRRFAQSYGYIANFIIVDLDPTSDSGVAGLEAAVAATRTLIEQREKASVPIASLTKSVAPRPSSYRQPT